MLPKIRIYQKYALFQKKYQMKIVQNWILYQNVCEELRIAFSISVWSINQNRISENRKKIDFLEPI